MKDILSGDLDGASEGVAFMVEVDTGADPPQPKLTLAIAPSVDISWVMGPDSAETLGEALIVAARAARRG